jgi:deoxyribodipyrimidine photo-lyase
VRPSAHARTRNALDSAVSGLSPYVAHGFVTLADVLAKVAARHTLDIRHKFLLELGWRACFRHVWQHRGQAILHSLHQGPLPDDAYARDLPAETLVIGAVTHSRNGGPASRAVWTRPRICWPSTRCPRCD